MDYTIPNWLDTSFFIQVVKSLEDSKQEVELVNFLCEAVVPPGSNYLSELHRVSVEYKNSHADEATSVSLIVKVPLAEGRIKEFIENSDGYKNELIVYKEILPKLYELNSTKIISPKSYYCPVNSALVLEDLRASGYKMVDRVKQLDIHHCRQFLLTLARLHALSIAAHHRHPQLIESISPQLIFNDRAQGKLRQEKKKICNIVIKGMVNTIKKIDSCKKYAEIIDTKIECYWERMINIFKPREGLTNVLNHGDTWTVNIMFKYNKAGEVIDAKLVDFQLCHFCSFASDVLHFWCTSANEDVRQHHKEEMFEVYRKTLNKTLHELDCTETLSKEQFDYEIKLFAPYLIYLTAGLLSLVMADNDNLLDVNSLLIDNVDVEALTDDAPQWTNFKSKYFKAALPRILRDIEALGAFE